MTTTEAYKEICDYFDLEPLPHGKKKLLGILESVCKVKETVVIMEVKHIVKHVQKPMYVLNNPIDLVSELRMACEYYGVTLEQVRSKSRKSEIICARVHFCRSVKSQNKRVKLIQLAALLNRRDHTDIHNYLFNSKANVPFEQFEPVKRKSKKL